MRARAFACGLILLSGVIPMPTPAQRGQRTAKAVDTIFADFQGRAPGASVLVIRNSRVALKKSYGLADLQSNTPASPKTNYRLASVSKQFTATAVMLLVERGKLSLDDDLTKIFPNFPGYGRTILVRHLLNHTSGLLAYEDLLPEDLKVPVVDADVLKILSSQDRTYFPPGSQFRYSNSGYALLACIVEKVSGMTYPEFLAKNIFRPVGMKSTFLTQRERVTGYNRAYGHSMKDGAWVRTDQSTTSFVLGDGGIYTSLNDLVKWEAAIAGAKLLPRKTLDGMRTATVPTSDESAEGYGYGWFTGKHGTEAAVWHTGSTIGFRNAYLRIPGKSLTVIVLTNRNNANAIGLARKVADVFLQ